MRSPDIGYVGAQSAVATLLDNIVVGYDNRILSAPGMTQGTTTNTSFKAANTTSYMSSGIVKSKATFEVAGTAGNGTYTGVQDVTPNASSVQERVYVVYLSATGTPTIIAGTQSTGAGTAPYPDMPSTIPSNAAGPEGMLSASYPTGIVSGPLPLLTNGYTPIGGCRIAVAAGATGFEMGTTQPATAGAITATYFDGYPHPQFYTAQ